jgi:two-component system NtrC family response regulator
MGQGRMIRAEDLDLPFIYDFASKKQTLKDVRENLEREFISKALSSNSWNVAKTAEMIGVTRPTLYDLIRKYDLKKQEIEIQDT